jgi:hypothetical protein
VKFEPRLVSNTEGRGAGVGDEGAPICGGVDATADVEVELGATELGEGAGMSVSVDASGGLESPVGDGDGGAGEEVMSDGAGDEGACSVGPGDGAGAGEGSGDGDGAVDSGFGAAGGLLLGGLSFVGFSSFDFSFFGFSFFGLSFFGFSSLDFSSLGFGPPGRLLSNGLLLFCRRLRSSEWNEPTDGMGRRSTTISPFLAKRSRVDLNRLVSSCIRMVLVTVGTTLVPCAALVTSIQHSTRSRGTDHWLARRRPDGDLKFCQVKAVLERTGRLGQVPVILS